MAQQIPIQAIPNQALTVTIDGIVFGLMLRTIGDFTAVSVTINDVLIVDGNRVPASAPFLPYHYEENGNFMFVSNGFQLPFYTNFNRSQILVYFTASELATFRALPPPVFNPIANLPLRYKTDYSDPLLTTDKGIGITTNDGIQITVAEEDQNPIITTNFGDIITTDNNDQITT